MPHFVSVPVSESSIIDRRAEFAAVFCALLAAVDSPPARGRECAEYLHIDGLEFTPDTGTLDSASPGRLHFAFVPGLFGECIADVVTPFEQSRAVLESLGHETSLIMVSGRSGPAHNARQLAEALTTAGYADQTDIVLVGYSKGTTDILEAIVSFPDAVRNVVAVVSVAGVVNGTPIASDASGWMRWLADSFPFEDCAQGDGKAIDSMGYNERQSWLATHDLDPRILFFSIAAYATSDEMSRALGDFYDDLASIDTRNDGQLLYRDAIIPGSVLLAYVRADHWAVALPVQEDDLWIARSAMTRTAYPRDLLLWSVLVMVQREFGRQSSD